MAVSNIFEYCDEYNSFKCKLKDISHVELTRNTSYDMSVYYKLIIHMKNQKEFNLEFSSRYYKTEEVALQEAKKIYDKINLNRS